MLDAVGHLAQRQLAQGHQVTSLKEVRQGLTHLFRGVDLAFAKALLQRFRGHINEHHLIGELEHTVGDPFAHHDAGQFRHQIVEAFQVLNVERRIDIDAR